MRCGSLFSGIGVMDYGLHLAGMEHVWFCEKDPFRRSILEKRWPGVPIHDDITTFSPTDWASVDIIAGGFPPTGLSTVVNASKSSKPSYSLADEMVRCISEVHPRWVLVESLVPILITKSGSFFGDFVGSLASFGYDIWWDCLPACAFGAPHRRDRIFVTARLANHTLIRQQDHNGNHLHSGHDSVSSKGSALGEPRAVGVEWGDFQPAIDRWGEILGRAAPKPLVRRVDDRAAERLERSRVSAVCDGILVQAAKFCGDRIMHDERSFNV